MSSAENIPNVSAEHKTFEPNSPGSQQWDGSLVKTSNQRRLSPVIAT
ncbi:MAG: hypothetical protein U9O54_01495 [Chloroflexota bacterium]|nr:hypothetical protein [Chloroflexota bacterium]